MYINTGEFNRAKPVPKSDKSDLSDTPKMNTMKFKPNVNSAIFNLLLSVGNRLFIVIVLYYNHWF